MGYLCRAYSVDFIENDEELFEAIQYIVNNKLEIEEVVEVLKLKENK